MTATPRTDVFRTRIDADGGKWAKELLEHADALERDLRDQEAYINKLREECDSLRAEREGLVAVSAGLQYLGVAAPAVLAEIERLQDELEKLSVSMHGVIEARRNADSYAEQLRSALEAIQERAAINIPFYAYGDNEAACAIAAALRAINDLIADALAMCGMCGERLPSEPRTRRDPEFVTVPAASLAPLTGDEPRELARRFHEVYERLAPMFGYKARLETRHFDPQSDNGQLMTAVCTEIFGAKATPSSGSVLEPKA